MNSCAGGGCTRRSSCHCNVEKKLQQCSAQRKRQRHGEDDAVQHATDTRRHVGYSSDSWQAKRQARQSRQRTRFAASNSRNAFSPEERVASPVGCQCTLQPVAKTIRGSRYRCTAASTTRPSQAHKWQLYSLTQQERQGDALMSAANDSSCRTSPMLARFLQVQRVLLRWH